MLSSHPVLNRNSTMSAQAVALAEAGMQHLGVLWVQAAMRRQKMQELQVSRLQAHQGTE